MKKEILDFAKSCVELAGKKGAGQSEAFCEWGKEFSVSARNQEVENLTQSTSAGIGLRIIIDGKLGFGYTSEFSPTTAPAFVDRVIALAKETASDPNNKLPEFALTKERNKTPDIYDPKVADLSADWKINAAIEMEKVALAQDSRIKTVEDVGVGNYIAQVAIVNSLGLQDEYQSTYIWMYCVPFAQDESGGQTDYWQDVKNFYSDLQNPEEVAKLSAERTLRMLGAEKIPTAKMPIVFDPNMSKSFISGIVGAINGDMIYKKASFLLDKLDTSIASDKITIIDDGTMDRGVGSSPFDGEGVPTRKNVIVDKGVLKMYLYDAYTANKAGAKPTGNASRSFNSLPSIGTNNFYLAAGDEDPKKIIGEIDHGLYVTKMMGRGANAVNGDYSRGANGLLIEKGKLTRPVQEVTIAGNMLNMLKKIDAVGNDLDFRGSTGAPTLRFSELAVSGK